MSVSFQPVRVTTGLDENRMMVLDEEQRLGAILVRLFRRDEVAPGQWYLEAGFGPVYESPSPAFADLDVTKDRISQRLARESLLS